MDRWTLTLPTPTCPLLFWPPSFTDFVGNLLGIWNRTWSIPSHHPAWLFPPAGRGKGPAAASWAILIYHRLCANPGFLHHLLTILWDRGAKTEENEGNRQIWRSRFVNHVTMTTMGCVHPPWHARWSCRMSDWYTAPLSVFISAC